MSETNSLEIVIDFYKSMNNTDEDPDVVAEGNKASAELAELEADKDALSNLLAVLHRDGGHHEGDVGTKQATEDAIKIYYQLRAELDEAIRVIKAFSDHDDYIGRKTVMQVADEFLAAHKGEQK
jgi:transcription elongation factor GreA-like protein